MVLLQWKIIIISWWFRFSSADLMAENGIGKKLIKIGLNGYAHGASKMYLMTKYGIDAMNLVKSVEELIGKDLGIKEDDLDNQRFVDFLEV